MMENQTTLTTEATPTTETPVATMTTERTEVVPNVGVDVVVPTTTTDVVPLNCQSALASFTEAEQKEIIALANDIDVRKIDNVMSYGSVALKKTFDQCGKFLKDERGTTADQKVIAEVIELSKKASASYEDFNLVLQEPNFFQKIFLKFLNFGKDTHADKIENSAITSYNLLVELKTSCDSWLEMLKKSMADIEYSAISDYETISLLEKYIIAGNMAQERIENELKTIQNQHQETGLQQYSRSYEELKEGYDLFCVTMANLEKSRVMYHLSIGQLSLIKRSNRNVQISIHTQVDNSMALIGQQLRNAVINAKTREVLEGQQAITRLNDELIKEISKTVGLTAQQTEEMIYKGFYNMEAAKEAVSTIINACNGIQKTATEMLPKMKAETAELNKLIKELEPCVNSAVEKTLNIENTAPTIRGGDLKF